MKKDWIPTEDAFRQFLQWLDEGCESHGGSYVEMRRRLVVYFDRKNCSTPDELADETLNRAARKLDEEGTITDVSPAHYCYLLAKFVFLEYLRRADHKQVSFDELGGAKRPPDVLSGPAPDLATEAKEELLGSLERCLNQLAQQERELILGYYQGEGRTKIELRRRLAERLGLSLNALTIRACRIRNKVEECVKTSSREA